MHSATMLAAVILGLFLLAFVIRIVRWRIVLPMLVVAIAVTVYGTDITPALDVVELFTTNLFGGPQ